MKFTYGSYSSCILFLSLLMNLKSFHIIEALDNTDSNAFICYKQALEEMGYYTFGKWEEVYCESIRATAANILLAREEYHAVTAVLDASLIVSFEIYLEDGEYFSTDVNDRALSNDDHYKAKLRLRLSPSIYALLTDELTETLISAISLSLNSHEQHNVRIADSFIGVKQANLTPNWEAEILSVLKGERSMNMASFADPDELYVHRKAKLRSYPELVIAHELDKRLGVVWIPNCLTVLVGKNTTKEYFPDFLIGYGKPQPKWAVLEVEGPHHNASPKTVQYDKDRTRNFNHLGLNVYSFSDIKCRNEPTTVVDEFIDLLGRQSS